MKRKVPWTPIDPNKTNWQRCGGYVCNVCGHKAYYGVFAHVMEECPDRYKKGMPAEPFYLMACDFAKNLEKILFDKPKKK